MGAWTWPAYVGIIGGLALFAVFMLPIAALQYRRFGRFTWRRFLGAAGLSVYGVALVAYTLLPLPDPAVLQCPVGGSPIQLAPLHFLTDIRRETAGLGLSATLGSRAVLQVVFNVLLFVPWGMIVRSYFSRGILVSTLSGLLASVLVEATQYTGLWGIYGCSYRLADADDLLTNTLGAFVGALIAPLVLGFMPQRRELVASRNIARPVTVWRRWLGMLIDLAAFRTLGILLVIAYALGVQLLGHEAPPASDTVGLILSSLVPGVLVFYVPAVFGRGASLGQRMVWLTPVWDENRLWHRLLRASVVGGLFTVLTFFSGLFPSTVFGPLSGALLVAAFVSIPLTSKRGLSGLVSGARIHDVRSLREPALRR